MPATGLSRCDFVVQCAAATLPPMIKKTEEQR
jgi:hypothetical protein